MSLSTETDDDPFQRVLVPPENETAEERALRLAAEKEATRKSAEIDAEIDRERAEKKKRRAEIRILLLGPSGSGKSTTLKNLKLAFAPKALQAEANYYVTLIYLNVITSLRLLCDVLDEERNNFVERSLMEPALVQHIDKLRPILVLENQLAEQLHDGPPSPDRPKISGTPYEVTINVWKRSGLSRSSKQSLDLKKESIAQCIIDRIRQLLLECREDIEFIIEHPSTEAVFRARNRRLNHLPGYFLDDLGRLNDTNYVPTDDDILRTRIRTLGVSESKFKVDSGPDKGVTWFVYDVGGARSQRAAWVPYFDNVNAIIFLAPIGHFDQFLDEDPSVNCLKDTLELWESVITNRLLAKADIILFLNKFDILSQKLILGVRFSKFVTSYRDVNTPENVGRYLQKKFLAIHNQRSPRPTRRLSSHFTSVTDKLSTATLLAHCREVVLHHHFKQMSLI